VCQDGGDLVQCALCPKVYHIDCLGMRSVPKGLWICPWHSCEKCAGRSSTVGGLLIRCAMCPTALCFDCLPNADALVQQRMKDSEKKKVERTEKKLTDRGFLVGSSLFFECDECIAVRTENARQRTLENAQNKLAELKKASEDLQDKLESMNKNNRKNKNDNTNDDQNNNNNCNPNDNINNSNDMKEIIQSIKKVTSKIKTKETIIQKLGGDL